MHAAPRSSFALCTHICIRTYIHACCPSQLFRFVLRVQRAILALGALWTKLHTPADLPHMHGYGYGRSGMGGGGSFGGGGDGGGGGGERREGALEEAHAWHLLRLHVHELRHFVSGVQSHFVAHVCDTCWAGLSDAIEAAATVRELRQAHERYLDAASRHCLLHSIGLPTSSLITAVLALALSLHREVCSDTVPTGRAWAALVDASRRQFEMLLAALSAQPLAPRVLTESLGVRS